MIKSIKSGHTLFPNYIIPIIVAIEQTVSKANLLSF
jgi:hypothetical protein